MNEENYFDDLIAGSRPVLVDFYADWCEPCKWLQPIMEEVRGQIGDKAHTCMIDIEKHPELKKRFQIQSVPVLIIFKEGKAVWRMNGFTYARELSAELLGFIT